MKQIIFFIILLYIDQFAIAQYNIYEEDPLQNYMPNYIVVSKDNVEYYEEAFFKNPPVDYELFNNNLTDILIKSPELSSVLKNGTGIIETFIGNGYSIKTPFKNHKINGIRTITDSRNDYLSMEIPYKNGTIDGIVKQFIGKGVLFSETQYKKGVKNGVKRVKYTIKHNSRDSFEVVGIYKNGGLEKQLTIFTQNSKIIYPSDFKKGKVEVYDGDFLWLSYSLIGTGLKNGKYETFNILNSKTKYNSIKANYSWGNLDGFVEKYDNNGKLIEKNEFLNGKPIGKFSLHNGRNNTLVMETLYDQNGNRQGTSFFYNEQGEKYLTIDYKNNLRNGPTTYLKKGKPINVKNYSNGILDGKSYILNEFGDTTSISNYSNNNLINEISYFKSGKTKSVYYPQKSITYFDNQGNKIWTNNYNGEQSIGTIKHITYNQNDEKYFIYLSVDFDNNGKKITETIYYQDGKSQLTPYNGKYYKNGIGEIKNPNGVIEKIYFIKDKKVSKEEYDKQPISEQ